MNLKEIKNLFSDITGRIYLVGGALRDHLLGEKIEDVDLAVKGPTKKIAQQFAKEVEGSFVILDKKRAMYRVVTEDLTYDFNSLVGKNIKEDLSRRDFTINALALEIDNYNIKEQQLIDPYGGLNDLKQGIIKVVTNNSFVDDPLRILRGVRFKAQLGFQIEKRTLNLAAKVAKKLSEVANERIKKEVLKILSHPKSAENIDYLDEIGVLVELIPRIEDLKVVGPCKYHHEDVWTHSVFAVKQVEKLLEKDYWKNKIDETKLPLLKVAALFHDYGKLFTEKKVDGEIHFYGHQKVGPEKIYPILKRLTFSNREIEYITKLVRYHMRPLALYYADNLTFKGKHRFFKAGADFVDDICLLAAADKISTSKLNDRQEEIQDSLEFLRELIADKKESEQRTINKLINGEDLIRELDLAEGPKVGEILNKVEEKQAKGELTTFEEALKYAKKLKEVLK